MVQCIRLLKSFDAKAFHPKPPNNGNDDYELESIRKAKRGQATEQLVEIPIDHQIYDMIESEGSKGLTVTEVYFEIFQFLYMFFICTFNFGVIY